MQILGLLALCALMLLAAGCGGGDKSSSPAKNAAEPAAGTENGSSGSGGSGGTAKDCKEFEQAAVQVASEFQAALTGTGGSADVQKASKLFDELTDKAPDDIKGDFQVINDAFKKLAEALQGVDLKSGTPPDQATTQKLLEATSQIDQAKLSQASANITAWAQKNCSS
jgi:hypothetical protein